MPDLDESLLAAATAEANKDKPAEIVKEDTAEEIVEDTAEETIEETAKDSTGDKEGDPEQEKPSKKSASDTIRALKAERNAERLERERLISELAASKAVEHEREQQRAAAATAAERRAEEDRLALLDPTERKAYDADTRARGLENRLNHMQLQMQDATDRAIFQSKAAHDPLVEKYKDQVEEMLNNDRKKGYAATREEYLNFIVGRAVRAESEKTLSKKRETAGKRIDAVTSKSASARGSVAESKQGNSEEDRLRGVLI